MAEYFARNHINNLVKNIKPALAYDGKADFTAWQTEARSKLEELLGLPLEKGQCEFKLVQTARVEQGAEVIGYYNRPRDRHGFILLKK